MNVGGVDAGLDLDRNRRLYSRTPYDSIGTVSGGMACLDIESWDIAQDPENFGFKLESYIYSYIVIYRHRK